MFEEEFAKIPAHAPRLLTSLPGLRLRDAVPKVMLILPVFFCFVFLVFPLALLRSDPAMRLAMGPVEFTEGHVIGVGTFSGCRGAAYHRVKYAFSVAGRDYRGASSLCEESAYYSVTEGDTLEIRYLRRDPTVNAVRTGRRDETPPIFLFLMMPIFLLMMCGAIYWPSARDVSRAKRLFKNGRLAAGRVVFVKKRSAPYWAGMPSAGAAQVFITIPTSSGGTREIVAICRNDWLINRLDVGTTVHVAFADDQSTDAALLDAYLR